MNISLFHRAVLTLFLLSAQVAYSQSTAPVILPGVIDAHEWPLSNSPLPLIGLSQFYEGQLLNPRESTLAEGEIVNFPEAWKTKPNNEGGLGFGTYSLLVVLPSPHEKELSLSLPQIYSSYRLWANGKLIAENGTVGKSKEECIPQWMPQTVAFEQPTDSLSLVLQIANFHHDKGGIKEPLYLGSSALMNFKRSIAKVSNLAESVVLFSVGLFFLFLSAGGNKKKATFYFALLCLTWSVRSLFSNLYLFITFFPDFDWNTMVRIEYIGLYLTMTWAILFLSQLFHNESNIFFKYGLVFCNILFTAFTLFVSPLAFTHWLNLYLIVSAVLLLFSCFTVIRAWVNERVGSGLLTLSIVLGTLLFSYDIFVYEGFSTYDPFIFSVGYSTCFLLMAWALALHLGLIKSKPRPSTRLTYDDLYKNE